MKSLARFKLLLHILLLGSLMTQGIFIFPQRAAAAQTLDIRNYGARCDGSDDAGAVQAAINALNSGDTLNISCRAYIGASGLLVSGKNNVTIQATNGGGFISTAEVTNNNMNCLSGNAFLYVTNSSYSTIKDLFIDIQRRGNTGVAEFQSDHMVFSGNTIQNVGGATFNEMAGAFMAGGAGSYNTWTNNTIYGGAAWLDNSGQPDAGRGLWIGNGFSGDSCGEDHPTVTYNNVSRTGHTGIASNNTNGAVFSNNTVYEMCNPIVNPNISIGCAGIKTVPNDVSSNAISYIENNTIYNNRSGQGIQLESANTPGIIIRNNIITNVSGAGVYTGGRPTRNVQILNNTITGAYSGGGVVLVNTQNITISGNKFLDSQTARQGNAIAFQAISGSAQISNITISSNLFQGSVWGLVSMYNDQGVSSRIDGVSITGNTFTKAGSYAIAIEEKGLSGLFTNISASGNCFFQNSPGNVSDNRSNPLAQFSSSSSCSDPTGGGSADVTAPTVTITSPSSGSTILSAVTFLANASDNVGVTGVQFKVDGINVGNEDTSAPYSVVWDSASVANGNHTVSATARDVAGNTNVSSITVTVANVSSGTGGSSTIRVNAGGGSYTDSSGNIWSQDMGYSGGLADVIANTITNTTSQSLYQTGRWNNGPLDYQFTVPNGSYQVTLKFAETYFPSSGQRLMNVDINGGRVLTNFDIVAQAGGIYAAIDRTFTANVSNGVIIIHFTGVVDDPLINAIQIVPSNPAPAISSFAASPTSITSGQSATLSFTVSNATSLSIDNGVGSVTGLSSKTVNPTQTTTYTLTATGPGGTSTAQVTVTVSSVSTGGSNTIRIDAGSNSSYTDSLGNTWNPDSGYSGGSADVVTNAIANTNDQALYKNGRWAPGTLDYQFTLPNGSYQVTLKFAETYFTSVGQRVFNVDINGSRALTNFDIIGQAGAPFSAVDRTVSTTVSGGTLTIHFAATADDPFVGAIQILPIATDTTPPVLTNAVLSNLTSSGVTMTWQTDELSDTQVEYGQTTAYGSATTLNSALVTNHTSTLTGLSASTLYHFRFKSRDAAGNLAVATDRTFTTAASAGDTTAPSVPTNVSATVISASQINLSWTQSTDNIGVVGYKIFRGGVQIATSTTASYSNTGLSAGTAYTYAISAYDAAGNSSTQSGSVTATTQSSPDTTAPTALLTAPANGAAISGTVTLSASASDPAVAGQVTSGLKLITALIDGSVFATSTSGTLSKSLDTTKLTNGTHTISAQAQDNAGNVSLATSITITVSNIPAIKYARLIKLGSLEGLSAIPADPVITVRVFSPASGTALDVETLTANASHQYTVTFAASDPQIVNFSVQVNGYLSRMVTSIDTTVNSGTVLVVPTLLAGDFNADNGINSVDYSALNSHYNQNYPQADINGDGIINSLDYAILKNNWGRSGE